MLSGLGTSLSNGGTSSGGDLYFRVSPGRSIAEIPGRGEVKPAGGGGTPSSTGSGGASVGGGGEDWMMQMNQDMHYEMNLDVTFVPCPEDACLHGTCTLLPGESSCRRMICIITVIYMIIKDIYHNCRIINHILLKYFYSHNFSFIRILTRLLP